MNAAPRPFLLPRRLTLLEGISRLLATNPFDPAWEELVKAALGERYRAPDAAERAPVGPLGQNGEDLQEALDEALAAILANLRKGMTGSPAELALYQASAVFGLWNVFGACLQRLIDDDAVEVPFYDELLCAHRGLFDHPGLSAPEPGHLLAFLYQARRAWYFAATKIRGGSPSAAAARAAIWRANLGGDLCAYAAGVHRRMDEIPVLITGERGTGEELAVECVAWSRYIRFDPATRRFAARYAEEQGTPESTGTPSSGMLGPRAKAGEVSVEELTRHYVTRVHVLTKQNMAETARRTGLDWRTVKRWIDPARRGG